MTVRIWCINNFLSLNTAKCSFMPITTKYFRDSSRTQTRFVYKDLFCLKIYVLLLKLSFVLFKDIGVSFETKSTFLVDIQYITSLRKTL